VEGRKICQMPVVQLGKHGSGGRESLETNFVESLLVVYVCVSLLSLIDAKRESLRQ
jgi:hypothetical protein